ncbi:MAG: RecX family transcriptional regulator [Kordiimonadaceae bacterium]|nr:RecX family transcriptional regulator [Kordiimonadaceae bacterium]MBO6570543.1 RecX family transcriptional regulator [Kordiimonadaceae bacterium]MBO6966338.1 RecX family transcriptional regulator [Kordiimonadaceae bacterium]
MPAEKNKNKTSGNNRPKKVTAGYLERAALHYLGRFSTSQSNLEAVLVRKIRRRNEGFAAPSDEQLTWVKDVVSKCVKYGYVDDSRYAQQRAESMLRRGKPVRMIAMDLKQKGISEEEIATTIETLQEESNVDMNRSAAAAFIKRRRFGCFRRPIEDREALLQKQQKELASMARAGFGFEISKEILGLAEDEIIELLV